VADNVQTPLVEAFGIVKRFGTLAANDVAAFHIRGGEILGLLGENGAGKSTLSKILYGYYRPDAGEIRVRGRPVTIASPRDARALGIGMVFQNFTLFPAMSVFENVALFLADLPFVVPVADVLRRMRIHGDRFRLSVDPWTPVRQLAVGDQQKVEILKQVLAGARVLIFDEPTKVLAPQETEGLYRTMAEFRAQGFGVVFITHKLREVLDHADRIAVMRQGCIVGTVERGAATEEELLALMFGGRVASRAMPARPAVEARQDCALELYGIFTAETRGDMALRDLSLSVRCGEIVGVAGVSGNGQRELGNVIIGTQPVRAGTKRLCGEEASNWPTSRVREKGVAFIPDDPLALACVPGLTVRENLFLGTGRRYLAGVGVNWQKLEADMQREFARLEFPRPSFGAPITTLSGGNLQRMVVARELAGNPRLIVALYPCRGLDALSTLAVRASLKEARDAGAGVLIVSEDLDELFSLSDRLVVLRRGAICGEFIRQNFRAEAVGALMVAATEVAATEAADAT
jgi:simple sugar transport system ATP-binding protein